MAQRRQRRPGTACPRPAGRAVGLPYLLLSATAPLLQTQFGRIETSRSPYRLYAVSNAGSLLALLSYPFVVEPFLAVRVQLLAWSLGFVAFAALCAYCTWSSARSPPLLASGAGAAERGGGDVRDASLRAPDVLMWLAFSAAPAVLLLATTQQISQEISVVPLLWILPLAVYLLSFVACFDGERWCRRRLFAVLAPASCLLAGYVLPQRWEISLVVQVAVFVLALFCCCMACHGELALSKPPVERLTSFYLCVSAGGALGGLFCTGVAPRLFTRYWELHIGIAACVVLPLVAYARASRSAPGSGPPGWAWCGLGAAALAGMLGADAMREFEPEGTLVERSRNFYGVLSVYALEDESGRFYALDHGRIRHGLQYLDPARGRLPSSYYHPQTGVGLALGLHPARRRRGPEAEPFRIGVVGLGVGTLAVYAREGDQLCFYEIDPEVIRMAEQNFTYLENTRSELELVLGDARVEMERELAEGRRRNFDVLVIDAFSSDAVPMHLLTLEAFELYWEHLKPDGILAVNVTSLYVDLGALVRGTARRLGYESRWVQWSPGTLSGFEPNAWILVTRNRAFLENPIARRRTTPWSLDARPDVVWTDDYGALLQVLRR